MKKIMLVVGAFLLLMPLSSQATGSVSIDYYQVEMSDYFYPQTFDNLVLDFGINAESGDALHALVVQNAGSARPIYEIEKVVLWEDEGESGFQGFAVDKKIAEAVYENNYWVFSGLNELIFNSSRFFVSVDTRRSGTLNKTFQFSLPAYNDVNFNVAYDSGDTGMFLASGLGFPMETFINNDYSYYKNYNIDIHAPVSVITNLSSGQSLVENSFMIGGASKDQGGGIPVSVEVCVDEVCNAVLNTGENYSTWSYNWTNIASGSHQVYVKTIDAAANLGESSVLTVSRTAPVETEPEVVPPPVTPPSTVIDYTVGKWVKLANASAVYFLDSNNVRHAYPTLKVWQSYWGNDFSKVKVISDTEMAGYSLGRNVPFNVGTLMKIPSVPKVYYVAENAVLRWVTTENAAIVHFGSDWAKTVKDLPESFFTDYTIGTDIGSSIILNAD